MAPALDAGNIPKLHAQPRGMFPGGGFTGQDNAGRTIGDLAAVLLAHTAFNYRVEFIVAAECALGKLPVAGLGAIVGPGIGEIDLRDAIEMPAVNAVAAVVFPGNPVEQERPGKIAVCRLPASPGGGAQVFGAGFPIHVAHQLKAQHTGDSVVPRFDIAHGGQDGYGTGRAGRLVARGGHGGHLGEHLTEEAADQALPGKQVADEIAYMADLNPGRFDVGVGQAFAQCLGKHVEQSQALAGPVAGEVGLAAAQDINIGCSLHGVYFSALAVTMSCSVNRCTLPSALRGSWSNTSILSGNLKRANPAASR